MKNIKKYLTLIGSILVAAFLMFLVLRNAGMSGIESFIQKISPIAIILAIVLYTGEMFVRAYRWKAILKLNNIEVTILDSFWGYTLGNGLNIFMPAKLGDIARSYYLKSINGSKYTDTLPTTILDRFYDIVGIYVVLLFDMIFIISTIKIERWLFVLLIVGVMAMIIGFVILEILEKNRNLLKIIPSKSIRNLAEAMLTSFKSALRNPIQFFKLSFLSFIIWGLECMIAFAIFYGAGIEISPTILAFGIMIATLSKVFPITPGGIGVFEGTMVLCFAMFGLKAADFAVSATFFHLILNAYGTITAVYIIIKRGIKTIDISKEKMII